MRDLRAHCSRLSWQRGIANFFLNKIPFSFATGKWLASGLGELLHAFYKQKLYSSQASSPFVFAELGAGTGLLSHHILDYVKTTYPDTYHKLQFWITDNEPSIIKTLGNSQLFHEHLPHVEVDILDARFPTFKKNPHVVVCCHLLDSWETLHLEYDHGKWYEIGRESIIHDGTVILDTTVFPPKPLSGPQIQRLTQTKNAAKLRILSPKLIRTIQDRYHRIPIKKNGFTHDEILFLNRFCQKQRLTHFRFNYCPGFRQWFHVLYENTAKNAMVFILDFGYISSKTVLPYSQLLEKFNTTIAYPLFIPLVTEAAEQAGFKTTWIPHPEGTTQCLLLTKGKGITIHESFHQLFSNLHPQAIHSVLEKIEKGPKDSSFLKYKEALLDTLSPIQRQDYGVLTATALECVKRGLFQEAAPSLLESLTVCPIFRISSYELLSLIATKEGHFQKAREYCQNILDIFPDFPRALHFQAYLFQMDAQYTNALSYYTRYLPYADKDVWKTLLAIAVLSIQLGKKKKLALILDWISQTHKRFPNLIPKESLRLFENLRGSI